MVNTVKRKVCVVTGTRAEYGLLSGLMTKLQTHEAAELQIVACAAHLSEAYGYTLQTIVDDGFTVDAQVPMLSEKDEGGLSIAKAVARGVSGFAEAFSKLTPDVVVVLGDRYEILAAAQTALLMHIPLAHIHGGEVTEGAVDEALRHAITKMATLHFTAAEAYGQRVIQMGEQPERVFNVGSPGLDVIRQVTPMTVAELESDLGMSLGDELILVTYHPVTWSEDKGAAALQTLMAALESRPNATVIWTGANADEQGKIINETVQKWIENTTLNAKFVMSLGLRRYVSVLALAKAVVGNSSSGIIEAPAMQTPTVNIGRRQQGRLRATSVLDCGERQEEIQACLQQALSTEFQKLAQHTLSCYGDGNTAEKMVQTLLDFPLQKALGKTFYDVDFELKSS